jgi:photosystem II stability/assembly factor-like uncharacterized protein
MALGGGVIYATTFGGIYRSTDAGGTWTLMGTQPPPHSVVMDILVVDPVTPTTLYGSRGGPASGVFKSLDAGASWVPSGSGLPQYVFATLAINPRNPSHLFAGTEQGFPQGIYLSTDAGASWSLALSGIANVTAVVIDPTNPDRIYAIGDTPALRTAVVFSADGGRTWTTGNGLPDTGGRTSLAVDPGRPADVYASDFCCALIRKSTDYGANWTSMRLPLTIIETLVVDPKAPGLLYAGGDGGPTPGAPVLPGPSGVFRSADGGATWSAFNEGFPPFAATHRLLVDPDGRFLLALNSDARIYSYSFSPQQVAIPMVSPWGMLIFAALAASCAIWILGVRRPGV